MRILIFASRDAQHAAAARHLAEQAGATFVDRLSGQLPELLLVAKHKVVEPIVVLVLDSHENTLLRVPRLMTLTELRLDLASLASSS